MIEIDLGELKKAGKQISQFLEERLRTEVSVKGNMLIVHEAANSPRLGMKELKTQLKHVLHRLGLSDKYRVLGEHHKIRLVRLEEKPRSPAERKGTTPSPSQSLPYFFP